MCSRALRFDITGYPTVKFFPPGTTVPVNYEGPREVEPMLEYVNENANTFRTVAGELHELAGRIKVFDELIRVSETLDSALVAQLKTVSDSIKDSAAAKYVKEYVSIAEKIAAKGVEYIEKEINRVSGIISGGKITPDKKTELMIKRNILKSFGKQ